MDSCLEFGLKQPGVDVDWTPMFAYTDVEAKYRTFALFSQGLAAAFLASIGVVAVWKYAADLNDGITRIVPFGQLPGICMCCQPGTLTGVSAGQIVGIEGSVSTLESVPVSFEKDQEGLDCGCGDFKAVDPFRFRPFGILGVACGTGSRNAFVRAQTDPQSSIAKNVSTRHPALGIVEHIALTKRQEGFEYTYTQRIEDIYTGAMHDGDWGTYHLNKWVKTVSMKPGYDVEQEVATALWLHANEVPVWQHLKLGLVPSLILAGDSQIGGLLGVVGSILALIFRRKNSQSQVAQIYNERTLTFGSWFAKEKLPTTTRPEANVLPPPPGVLPPPPGLLPLHYRNHRDTE